MRGTGRGLLLHGDSHGQETRETEERSGKPAQVQGDGDSGKHTGGERTPERTEAKGRRPYQDDRHTRREGPHHRRRRRGKHRPVLTPDNGCPQRVCTLQGHVHRTQVTGHRPEGHRQGVAVGTHRDRQCQDAACRHVPRHQAGVPSGIPQRVLLQVQQAVLRGRPVRPPCDDSGIIQAGLYTQDIQKNSIRKLDTNNNNYNG